MTTIFVPYIGDKPASLDINGHKLVILSREKEELEESLDLIGADHLQVFEGGDSPEEQEALMQHLARHIEGGIVLAPADVDVEEVIKNLESQLPWVH
jgi:hypothetical protein